MVAPIGLHNYITLGRIKDTQAAEKSSLDKLIDFFHLVYEHNFVEAVRFTCLDHPGYAEDINQLKEQLVDYIILANLRKTDWVDFKFDGEEFRLAPDPENKSHTVLYRKHDSYPESRQPEKLKSYPISMLNLGGKAFDADSKGTSDLTEVDLGSNDNPFSINAKELLAACYFRTETATNDVPYINAGGLRFEQQDGKIQVYDSDNKSKATILCSLDCITKKAEQALVQAEQTKLGNSLKTPLRPALSECSDQIAKRPFSLDNWKAIFPMDTDENLANSILKMKQSQVAFQKLAAEAQYTQNKQHYELAARKIQQLFNKLTDINPDYYKLVKQVLRKDPSKEGKHIFDIYCMFAEFKTTPQSSIKSEDGLSVCANFLHNNQADTTHKNWKELEKIFPMNTTINHLTSTALSIKYQTYYTTLTKPAPNTQSAYEHAREAVGTFYQALGELKRNCRSPSEIEVPITNQGNNRSAIQPEISPRHNFLDTPPKTPRDELNRIQAKTEQLFTVNNPQKKSLRKIFSIFNKANKVNSFADAVTYLKSNPKDRCTLDAIFPMKSEDERAASKLSLNNLLESCASYAKMSYEKNDIAAYKNTAEAAETFYKALEKIKDSFSLFDLDLDSI